jgi:hypothetical protein
VTVVEQLVLTAVRSCKSSPLTEGGCLIYLETMRVNGFERLTRLLLGRRFAPEKAHPKIFSVELAVLCSEDAAFSLPFSPVARHKLMANSALPAATSRSLSCPLLQRLT